MIHVNPLRIVLGVLLAAVVSLGAYRLNALNRSGSLGAFFLGVLVFGFGGLPWAVVLLVFFITSSGLSRLLKKQKKEVEAQFAKSSQRDVWQVVANGGVAGLAALIGVFIPGSVIPWVLFASAFAAANADTWATELGVLSHRWPRSIRTWHRVPPGTSGGISLIGTLATAGGAALIAFAAWLVWPVDVIAMQERLIFSLVIFAGGTLGSLVDSLLGATAQAIFWCPVCQKETERHPTHICGGKTNHLRGWKWMNNDVVNLVCTASAALTSLLVVILLN